MQWMEPDKVSWQGELTHIIHTHIIHTHIMHTHITHTHITHTHTHPPIHIKGPPNRNQIKLIPKRRFCPSRSRPYSPRDSPQRQGGASVPCRISQSCASETFGYAARGRSQRPQTFRLDAPWSGMAHVLCKWRPRGVKIVPAWHNFVFQPYAL